MMWMMGYNDGGELNNIQDPFNAAGRKLRPLMPRPATTSASASTNPIHGTDLFALNHHLAMAEQNKRELTRQQVVVSSRWNPTPEQLQTLEELYRRGTRTPSADQIQHITSQLRRYGKIEGKNVFYWFQNHKARERQKRRRRLESLPEEQQNQNNYTGEKPEPEGANRTVYEVEQTKIWASPTNSSTVATEKALSAQIGAADTGSKADGWVHDEELQHRRNATWQMMHNLSSPQLLTSTTAINQSTVRSRMKTKNPPKDFIFINNVISMEPYNAELNLDPSISNGGDDIAQTLELFPLQSTNQTLGNDEEEEEELGADMCSDTITPYKFFEFLPLKN